jgi:uncharacterized membrane protein YhaH (DUF805 family)
MNWYLLAIKKYAKFTGRARRREYWWFQIINFIIILSFIAISHFSSINLSVVNVLYNLLILIPSYAVLVRRLHDIGNSSWWVFFPVLPFIITTLSMGIMLHVHKPQSVSVSVPAATVTAPAATKAMASSKTPVNAIIEPSHTIEMPAIINQWLASPALPKQISEHLRESITFITMLVKNLDVVNVLMFDLIFFAIFQLFCIGLLFFFTIKNSQPSENQYGPNPKAL